MSNDKLLPGERIERVSAHGLVPKSASTDEAINDKYVRGEIRIVVEQARYQLKQVPALVQSADYDLQPDFQRRPRWGAEKRSRLIESFIINVPVPPVFLYEAQLSRFEVMDGKQRLTTIAEFYDDKFALEGLREWPELNGRKYSQLPEQVRRGIDRRYLSSIVLLHETAKNENEAERLKQLVFERINTGGEDLSPQEQRNALHPGPLNRACIRLSRHQSFCEMWDIPIPTSEELHSPETWQPSKELLKNKKYRIMEDAQLVLRFFAHRQRSRLSRTGGLDAFLTQFLISGNKLPIETIHQMEELFRDASDLALSILGTKAFWLYRKRADEWLWISDPTVVAYDPIMRAFSNLLDKSDALERRRGDIRKALPNFYRKHAAEFDGRKVNARDAEKRDILFAEFLEGFVY
ncbi:MULTISPECIES: DUF262 domain-containing protein [Nocardia]|uniref:DUF262 domain-containing protein n=1 Tax=Nocardia TaxID=1817 RepID=UPI001428BBFA|nr:MULTISPECIES: DUF262 domain-containing protein [Nocardia]